jgi:hypothetical protein
MVLHDLVCGYLERHGIAPEKIPHVITGFLVMKYATFGVGWGLCMRYRPVTKLFRQKGRARQAKEWLIKNYPERYYYYETKFIDTADAVTSSSIFKPLLSQEKKARRNVALGLAENLRKSLLYPCCDHRVTWRHSSCSYDESHVPDLGATRISAGYEFVWEVRVRVPLCLCSSLSRILPNTFLHYSFLHYTFLHHHDSRSDESELPSERPTTCSRTNGS